MSTTYIYVRVSTKEQAADGSSLATQAQECVRYIDSHGLKLGTESNYEYPGVFADPGVSAWKIPVLKRPGFLAMWLAMKPGDSFICLSIDRAFRSVHDFSGMCRHFEAADISPIFIRDQFDMRTPTGKLMAHMAASFAQFKSDMISARAKEGRQIADMKREAAGNVVSSPRIKPLANPKLASIIYNPHEAPETKIFGRAFGYARVSTKDQTTDSQGGMIAATMQRLGSEGFTLMPDVYHDHGVSAFSVDWRDRPQGKALFSEIQPHDCICVSRLDRIFRSVGDMANTTKSLIDRDIHLVTGCGLDTRTQTGRQGIEIMSLMAAWESREMSWRSKLMHANIRALRGKWESVYESPRWLKPVYKDNGFTLHPDFEMVAQYREVRELLDAGFKIQAAADLMEERVAARIGRPMVPAFRFNPIVIRRKLAKSSSRAQMLCLNKWIRHQKPDKNGDIEREWSYIRVKNASRSFEDIEDVMQV